jgi:hypothetical protein
MFKLGKISSKAYDCQKSLLIEQGDVKGNWNSCGTQHLPLTVYTGAEILTFQEESYNDKTPDIYSEGTKFPSLLGYNVF